MENTTNPFLNPEWQRLQQECIEALFSQKPRPSENPQSTHRQQVWNEALSRWSQSAREFVPEAGGKLFETVLNQSRQFYSIADNFTGLLQAMLASNRQADEWRSIMGSHFKKMKTQFDTSEMPHDPWNTISLLFQSPAFNHWQKAYSAIFPQDAGQEDIDKLLERLSALPAFGPVREFQDKIARATHLWKAYQKKLQEYHSVLSGLGKIALDRLEQKIIELANNKNKITSLRQIYNLWIDANEEVYARFAFTEEHARLYGELVNALMACRQQCNLFMDTILGAMNMPTGEGMNTVYKRQHQMMQALRDTIEKQQQMELGLEKFQTRLERVSSSVGKAKPSVKQKASSGKNVIKKKKMVRKPK